METRSPHRPRVATRGDRGWLALRGALALLLGLLGMAGCGASRVTDSRPAVVAAREPASPAAHGRRRSPFRMLIIGNSLTYANDLPGFLEALSSAAGDDPPMEVESVAYADFALEDHLAQGDAPRRIAEGGWDLVALQQGPSTLPASRENLIEYSTRFAVLIRDAGAEPALYGVWPPIERRFAFDDGIESYRLAAEAVDGTLFPVALAWKEAWARDPQLPFHSSDGFHPSPLGTYTAALVIYSVVRSRSAVGLATVLTVNGIPYRFDPSQALLVQEVVEGVTGAPRLPERQPWLWPRPTPPARTGRAAAHG